MLSKLLNLYILMIVSTTILNAKKSKNSPVSPLIDNVSRKHISLIFEFIKSFASPKLTCPSFNTCLYILGLTRFILYKYVLPARTIWELCRFQKVNRLNTCFTRISPNATLYSQGVSQTLHLLHKDFPKCYTCFTNIFAYIHYPIKY